MTIAITKAENGWVIERRYLLALGKPVGKVTRTQQFVARNDEELLEQIRAIAQLPLEEDGTQKKEA